MPKTNSFSITEVAAWALPAASGLPKSDLHVELPALQRRAVWPAYQVERLWDFWWVVSRSVVSSFPSHNHTLVPRSSWQRSGEQKRPSRLHRGGHLLLDWTTAFHGNSYRLPRPLEESAYANGKAEFSYFGFISGASAAVRTIRSFLPPAEKSPHPWGDQRANAAERLSTSAKREAMLAYEQSAICADKKMFVIRPGHLPLEFAWPHDARTPRSMPMIRS